MKLLILILLVFLLNNAQAQEECQVLVWEMTDQGKQDVVDAHNRYRQMLIDGQVDGQPQAKSLNMLTYDEVLGEKAKVVSQQCKLEHVHIDDDRWYVGQNLFIALNPTQPDQPDWQSAVDYWWNEHEFYDYDSNASTDKDKEILHYTQVAWANTEVIGCDYILYYDATQPSYPYSSLYTCNYGPGGNFNNEKPYELA